MGTLGIALSGIQSAQTRIGVSAHNVANYLTEDFRPQRVVQTAAPSGGTRARVQQSRDPEPVSLEREIVSQITAKTAYTASVRVFEVGAKLEGALLDIFA
ncbi:MAG TPA: flagellar basal body rod protein [Myxococcales bacterium]|nr:flagellar basal body rod protein [Myxococcales bacterium]HIM01603.1 flagellar basal body rod protein [Myxococcales bacterium]